MKILYVQLGAKTQLLPCQLNRSPFSRASHSPTTSHDRDIRRSRKGLSTELS